MKYMMLAIFTFILCYCAYLDQHIVVIYKQTEVNNLTKQVESLKQDILKQKEGQDSSNEAWSNMFKQASGRAAMWLAKLDNVTSRENRLYLSEKIVEHIDRMPDSNILEKQKVVEDILYVNAVEKRQELIKP